jgi:hypothetical protein
MAIHQEVWIMSESQTLAEFLFSIYFYFIFSTTFVIPILNNYQENLESHS